MNIEHIAFNVADPVAMADWYVKYLGMRVVRAVEGAPHTRFLADESDRVVLEFYHQKAPVPDYESLDPMVLHIAFVTSDIPKTRDRLVTAGARVVGETTKTASGDELLFLRDRWGIALQLVKRATPLH